MWNWILANVPPAVKKMGNSLLFGTKKYWSWIVLWSGKGLQLMKRLLVAVGVGIAALFKWVGRTLHRFLCLMPLTWQWLLTGFVMTMVLYICLRSYKTGWILIGFGVFFGIILYGAHAFGILMENARNMGKGDLETKISDRFLVGAFRDFAGDLNTLADVAKVAAQEQMKSERMKTELITNVSHDIKTPLTSIINYVDLLEKPHTIEEERQYLEVLGRKSQQLKKLIGDLTEMSKASSGSIAVNVEWVDAAEAINQALGEFSDKLELCRLTPVFNRPEEPVYIRADGRLTWRVLSNLLSNAVKYAMPGTRLYIDLCATDNRATISLKNISKEPLNVDAQELMERFVRGDASRNTEGSGLGLNIAKSLMEVQNGQLTLTVDGDLFKATLQFPVTKQ
jgi:signal transduction histidine kinase